MKVARPMVYGGESCSKAGLARLRSMGWGQCCSEGPTAKQELPFFFDNGAWPAFIRGLPFPDAAFLRRVERTYDRGQRPDFVVIPDVVANAKATLQMADRWHPILPVEWPKYLALQDGMEAWDVAALIKSRPVDGVFLGGTDWFKNNQAQRWRDFARQHGIKFHYARAGTPRKFRHAMLIGSDSLDSSRLSRDGTKWSDFARCSRLWTHGLEPRLFSEHDHTKTAVVA